MAGASAEVPFITGSKRTRRDDHRKDRESKRPGTAAK